MSKIFVSTESDGEGAWMASVDYEPPTEGGWTLEQIEAAERGDEVRDDEGQSLVRMDVPAWVIVVTWDEPESGREIHGIYGGARAAHADMGRVLEQYMNEGELPEDVKHEITEVQS